MVMETFFPLSRGEREHPGDIRCMQDERPDPETLLARVQEEEAQQARGKLKIFLGAAAGVGKTYAMLEAAHERRAEGVDVIVGWVDAHGRVETAAFLQGLEILPCRPIEYRASLYAMSRDLASTQGQAHLLQVAARHIGEVFDSHVAILLPSASGALQAWGSGEEAGETDNDRRVNATTFVPDTREQGVAQWVYAHQQMAGLGTATLPSAGALYLPLTASRGTVGVLGLRPAQPQHLLAPEQVHWLETFASQTALALERAILADEAQHAQVQIEAERLRNTLLSTVSHDLRTPLAAIAGAASSLLEGDTVLPTATRHELLQAICDETERLNRLVSNVLEMTRLESGAMRVAKEWQPLEEVVGAALTRLEAQLHDRPLSTHLPPDLPLVPLDSVLIEQVLINLLDNALKYTPLGSPMALSAWVTDDTVTVEVADYGPGVPPGEEQRLFEKLYRGQTTGARHGFGLGLTICRGIIAAHGGRIWAENRPGGGAALRFTLPLHGPPLPVLPEPEIPSDLSPDLGDHAALRMLGT